MNFANVKSITIPEGDVRSIAIGGVTVWEKPNPLPYDAEVEYVESTGTQYIDTGVAFLEDFAWEIKFENSANGSTIFGCGNGSTRTSFIYKGSNEAGGKYSIPVGGNNAGATPFTTQLKSGLHTFKFAVANNKGSLWVDGIQTHNQTAFAGEYISGVTAAIFCAHNGTSYNQLAAGKVYFVNLWQGSTLVRSFVPVRVGTAGALYDRVSGNLFYSATATPLVAGPDKNGV